MTLYKCSNCLNEFEQPEMSIDDSTEICPYCYCSDFSSLTYQRHIEIHDIIKSEYTQRVFSLPFNYLRCFERALLLIVLLILFIKFLNSKDLWIFSIIELLVIYMIFNIFRGDKFDD